MAIPGWTFANNRLWMPEDDDLVPTPQQTEGPFYPQPTIEQQLHNDTDLRRKLGKDAFAQGQPIQLSGVIKSQTGKPLSDAVVEIWQACATGKYNHNADRSQAKIDKDFQFWGRAITGKNGKYSFLTIIPGKYPGRFGRHIHFRVDADGHKRCSTQCYFSKFGEDNMRDGIYRRLDKKEREQVTVELDPPSSKKTKTVNKESKSNSTPGKDIRSNTKSPKVVQPWQGVFDIVMATK